MSGPGLKGFTLVGVAGLLGLAGLVGLLVVAMPSSPAIASGSYTSRPTRPPATVDRESYELGKKIFAGEFTPSQNPGSAEVQRRELAALQAKLPRTARNRVDLEDQAGRLTPAQLDALRYFLQKRYKVH